MNNFKFTHDWFGEFNHIDAFIEPLNREKELHILEIGSFEGKGTTYFASKLLDHPKSTITCIDPWTSYTQDENSFNSYHKSKEKHKLNNPIPTWDFTTHKATWEHNINESGFKQQIKPIQGFSHEILPTLLTDNKKYDLIFVDGNHASAFVLTDAVMSFYLIKTGGIIIFDDYHWEPNYQETFTPKLGVDSFINSFKDYLEVLDGGRRKAVMKIK